MSTAKYKVESGIQLLARLRRKPDIGSFYPNLFENGPNSGEVIEIFSTDNVSCLLVDIISDILLPTSLGGVEAGVVIFNTDGNMNFDILVNTLRSKLHSCVRKSSLKLIEDIHKQVDELLQNILSNLFILDIYDATQLYTTLHNLESILVENSNVALVIFDTLTAFYWSEQGFKITKMDVYLKTLLRMIQKVTKDYKTTILYTRPEYFSSSKGSIENLEGCADQPSLEQVNYRIQLISNDDASYDVNIKTYNKLYKKSFTLVQNQLKWL